MKKVIIFFKNWLFNIRKKNAIKKAQQLANEQRRKFLVLNFNGKPTVISMKDIHKLIRTKQVKHRYAANYFREIKRKYDIKVYFYFEKEKVVYEFI